MLVQFKVFASIGGSGQTCIGRVLQIENYKLRFNANEDKLGQTIAEITELRSSLENQCGFSS
jgi:hypothetical protein